MAKQGENPTVQIGRPVGLSATNETARISRFRELASYNWLEGPEPVILVPGTRVRILPMIVVPRLIFLTLPCGNSSRLEPQRCPRLRHAIHR